MVHLYSSENGFRFLSCHFVEIFSTIFIQTTVNPLNGKDSYTVTIISSGSSVFLGVIILATKSRRHKGKLNL
jgi:hypothetical protein